MGVLCGEVEGIYFAGWAAGANKSAEGVVVADRGNFGVGVGVDQGDDVAVVVVTGDSVFAGAGDVSKTACAAGGTARRGGSRSVSRVVAVAGIELMAADFVDCLADRTGWVRAGFGAGVEVRQSPNFC